MDTYNQCVAAYRDRDYVQCVRSMAPILDQVVPYELLQIFAISLQRIGRIDVLNEWKAGLLAATRGHPFEHALLRVTLGELPPEEISVFVSNALQDCKSKYYCGCHFLTQGDMDQAQSKFRASVATGAECLEAILARHELEFPVPFGRLPRDRVRMLCESVVISYRAGDYRAAQSTGEDALRIAQQYMDPLDPDLLSTLSIVAMCYSATGNYHRAKELHTKALTGRTQIQDRNSADSAAALARISVAEKDYRHASNLLRQAISQKQTPPERESLRKELDFVERLAILSEKDTPDTADQAECLQVLAANYRRVFGEEAIAADLLTESIAHLSREDSRAESARQQLVGYYTSIGDFDRAFSLTKELLRDYRQALGHGHPILMRLMENLIVMSASTNRQTELATILPDALGHEKFEVNHAAQGADEDRQRILERSRSFIDLLLSLSTDPAIVDQGLKQVTADLILRRKALALELLRQSRERWLSDLPEDLQPKLIELTQLKRQLLMEAFSGPRKSETMKEFGRRIFMLDQRREDMERVLSWSIDPKNIGHKVSRLDRNEIAAKLPPKTVILEFVKYTPFDFKAKPTKEQTEAARQFYFQTGFFTLVDVKEDHTAAWCPPRYAVIAIQSDNPQHTFLTDIGEAEAIEESIMTVRETILRKRWNPSQTPDPESEGELLEHIQQLSHALLGNLRDQLRGMKTIIIAPDALLCLIPFEVLNDQGGRPLIDNYSVSYIVSTRYAQDFGRKKNHHKSAADFVAGAPDYDLADRSPEEAVDERWVNEDWIRRAGLHFKALSGAKEEVRHIAALLNVQPIVGKDVLKSRVRKIKSPRVLHIATHGFFIGPESVETTAWGRRADSDDSISMGNALFRSGLAMAGANTWLAKGAVPRDAEEGLLTALDVIEMDLRGTELAVLSACDVGIGDVLIGEGVLGLRRAFFAAGCSTVVMSLWKVPDQQTKELMLAFYEALRDGIGCSEALVRAKHNVRDLYQHPYYWAGFICIGDPGPLTAISRENT